MMSDELEDDSKAADWWKETPSPESALQEFLREFRSRMETAERRKPTRYVLDAEGRPKPEPDLMKWASWIEKTRIPATWDKGGRHVADEKIGAVRVSTVFLGLDHAWGAGPPIFWETMTFGPEPWHQVMSRCAGGREQAEAMHAEMVARVREGTK